MVGLRSSFVHNVLLTLLLCQNDIMHTSKWKLFQCVLFYCVEMQAAWNIPSGWFS